MAADSAPAQYDLKPPENGAIDAAGVERTAAIARELGLTNEAGQKTLEFLNGELLAQRETLVQAHSPGGAEWEKTVTQWEAAALAHPELGNGSPDVLKAHVANASRVISEFFPADAREFVDKTGIGSHPSLLRGLAAVAQAMKAAGKLTLPDGAPPSPKEEIRTADLLYGGGEKK